ncbi:MAG: YhdP family protein [Steroidobacteraceae bacterium]
MNGLAERWFGGVTSVWRWLVLLASVAAVGGILVIGLLRLAFELVEANRTEIGQRLTQATGLSLAYTDLQLRVGRHGPEVYLPGLSVVSQEGVTLVTAESGRASLALLRSAWFGRWEIGRVILEAPSIKLLIHEDHRVELVGQEGFAGRLEPGPEGSGLDRLPRGVIEVRGATVGVRDLSAGGAVWELTDVDLELQRKGDRVELAGSVDLPERFGRSLDLEATLEGDLARPQDTAWQVGISARRVELAGLRQLLPSGQAYFPTRGLGSLRVEASGVGGQLAGGMLELDVEDVAWASGGPYESLAYTRVGGRARLSRQPGLWQLQVSGLELSREGARWRPTNLSLEWGLDAAGWQSIGLRAGSLRLENLLPLAALLPGTSGERLLASGLEGMVRDVDLRLQRAGDWPEVSGQLRFARLGFAAVGRAPGVRGLEGSLRGRGPAGLDIELASAAVQLDWPTMWAAPITLTRASGRLNARSAPLGVQLALDDAVLGHQQGSAALRLRALLRPSDTPLVDLAAQVSLADLGLIREFLPVYRLKPKPLAWLQEAFPSGSAEARLQLTGPLKGFPYREGQGLFEAEANVQGARFVFAPGWQPLEELSAQVRFSGPSLSVSGAQGRIGSTEVREGESWISDFRTGVITVRAAAAGDAGAVQRVLRDSPLAPKLPAPVKEASVEGRLAGELVLFIPLREPERRMSTVRAFASGVRVGWPGFAERIEGATGEVWVRNTEVYAPRLSGRALGGPLSLSVDTLERDGRTLTEVVMEGQLLAERLQPLLPIPEGRALSGGSAWRALLELGRAAAPDAYGGYRLQVASDLQGLGSTLPAPLEKSPSARWPLQVTLTSQARDRLGLDLALPGRLDARLAFARTEAPWQLERGTLRLGPGRAGSLPLSSGLLLRGRIDRLDVDELTALRWRKPAKRRFNEVLQSLDLDVGRLKVLGREFADVSLAMKPTSTSWAIEVDGPAVSGGLRVPYDFRGDEPLTANLDRLHLPEGTAAAGQAADPAALPGLQFEIDDLRLAGATLGRLRLEAVRSGDGLEFDRLELRHPAFEVSGRGSWRGSAAENRSAFAGSLDSTDLSGLLRNFSLAPALESRRTRATADLSWPGPPDVDLLARVSGSASIQLVDGRMKAVDPGAGRLLGLLSLSHIGRRLTLDFGDVTGEGMSFDSIKGDFQLRDGVAHTDNLTLRGSVADIGIAGDTNLRERSYDQTAVVTGDLGASLGVAGTLAGGPAVGAALLLFSQIFKEPLKGVARGYYRITGPWQEPEVRKVDAEDMEAAARRSAGGSSGE